MKIPCSSCASPRTTWSSRRCRPGPGARGAAGRRSAARCRPRSAALRGDLTRVGVDEEEPTVTEDRPALSAGVDRRAAPLRGRPRPPRRRRAHPPRLRLRLLAVRAVVHGAGVRRADRRHDARAAPLRRRRSAERDVVPATVARKLAALRALYRTLREHGVMPANPADLVPAPKRRPSCRAVLKADEVAALLDRIPRRRRWSSATARCSSWPTRAACAPRSSSTSTRGSMDFDAEEVRVEGKGGKTRIVPVGEAAVRALTRYVERARPALATDRRRARAVPLQVRPAAVDARRPAAPARVVAARRAAGRRAPARAAPLVRDPPARRRRGPARDPGAARPQQHLHDADLHSGRVRAGSSRRMRGRIRGHEQRQGHGWRPTSRRSSCGTCGAATRRRGRACARAARRRLLAAGQVRRRPHGLRPAGARRGGRPHLLRPGRPDQRDRALRPRARDQVRDLRDHPHQGRDHRRAALPGLGAALGPRQGPRDREGQHQARAPAPARADRRGDVARAGDHRSRTSRSRCCRSPTRRSPRWTSCGRSATRAATRSRCWTRSPTRTRRTRPR